MALTKSLSRLDAPTLQTHGEGMEREALLALSQRKLNALGMPVCYIDAGQHYRFVNRAFLDWTGKSASEIIGREIVEVVKRLELEAGEREHRLRIVTDSVGLPIFYFDRALRLRFANKPYGTYIGAPVDDLLGQPLKNFVAPDALAEMQGYIERAFAGATVSYDRRERPASGELRWVRITLFPDREPGGRIGGAFVVLNDIEDDVRIREVLKAQEAQLRLFADNIPGPIAYLDKSLRYTFVNQAFANWL